MQEVWPRNCCKCHKVLSPQELATIRDKNLPDQIGLCNTEEHGQCMGNTEEHGQSWATHRSPYISISTNSELKIKALEISRAGRDMTRTAESSSENKKKKPKKATRMLPGQLVNKTPCLFLFPFWQQRYYLWANWLRFWLNLQLCSTFFDTESYSPIFPKRLVVYDTVGSEYFLVVAFLFHGTYYLVHWITTIRHMKRKSISPKPYALSFVWVSRKNIVTQMHAGRVRIGRHKIPHLFHLIYIRLGVTRRSNLAPAHYFYLSISFGPAAICAAYMQFLAGIQPGSCITDINSLWIWPPDVKNTGTWGYMIRPTSQYDSPEFQWIEPENSTRTAWTAFSHCGILSASITRPRYRHHCFLLICAEHSAARACPCQPCCFCWVRLGKVWQWILQSPCHPDY